MEYFKLVDKEYHTNIDKFLLTILEKDRIDIKKLFYIDINHLNNTVQIDFRELKIENDEYINLYGAIHPITLSFFNYKETYYFEFDIKKYLYNNLFIDLKLNYDCGYSELRQSSYIIYENKTLVNKVIDLYLKALQENGFNITKRIELNPTLIENNFKIE